ncbi:MAG: hypothetical protein WC845_01830 [Candidatus Staskawiczbacteria bacterium]|jgi:hypothetical protein
MEGTKIILSVVIFLSVVGFSGTVNAAEASLYISPATLTKTAGDTFDASVGVSIAGNKICAIEGTLVFDNISCQSITVSSNVMTQFSPTCSNPRFLIGIPSCTTSDKILVTVSVKPASAGTASISLTGVDIIGEGASISTESIGGNYTINAPVVEQEEPVVGKEVTEPKAEQAEVAPANEEVVAQGQKETAPANPFLASLIAVQNAISIWLLLAVVAIAGLGCGVSYFFKKFKIVKR